MKNNCNKPSSPLGGDVGEICQDFSCGRISIWISFLRIFDLQTTFLSQNTFLNCILDYFSEQSFAFSSPFHHFNLKKKQISVSLILNSCLFPKLSDSATTESVGLSSCPDQWSVTLIQTSHWEPFGSSVHDGIFTHSYTQAFTVSSRPSRPHQSSAVRHSLLLSTTSNQLWPLTSFLVELLWVKRAATSHQPQGDGWITEVVLTHVQGNSLWKSANKNLSHQVSFRTSLSIKSRKTLKRAEWNQIKKKLQDLSNETDKKRRCTYTLSSRSWRPSGAQQTSRTLCFKTKGCEKQSCKGT